MRKLIKWIRDCFDWTVIEVQQGGWYEGKDKICYAFATYEIFYSKSRNKYKLKLSGYKPKQHAMYNLMIKLLNRLNNETKNMG